MNIKCYPTEILKNPENPSIKYDLVSESSWTRIFWVNTKIHSSQIRKPMDCLDLTDVSRFFYNVLTIGRLKNMSNVRWKISRISLADFLRFTHNVMQVMFHEFLSKKEVSISNRWNCCWTNVCLCPPTQLLLGVVVR